jgi:hypothetical protein
VTIKIAIGLVFYEDMNGLARTLLSVADHVHEIFCIDGVYNRHPLAPTAGASDGLSHDGSREICKAFSNVSLIDMPFVTEVQKRNRYLELAKEKECDLLIILDSDEYVPTKEGCNDWERFYSQIEKVVLQKYRMCYNMFNMYLHDVGMTDDANQWTHKPRLLFKPYQIEYWYNHHTFRKKAEYIRINPSPVYPVDVVDGVRIWHDQSLRGKQRMQARKVYQDWILAGGEGK